MIFLIFREIQNFQKNFAQLSLVLYCNGANENVHTLESTFICFLRIVSYRQTVRVPTAWRYPYRYKSKEKVKLESAKQPNVLFTNQIVVASQHLSA